MNRRRVARYALQAHPSAARAALGDVMLVTLLEASAGARRRFAREMGTKHDMSALPWLFVAAAPVVLATAITRTRLLQRLTPL
jgi:hypothetical protein